MPRYPHYILSIPRTIMASSHNVLFDNRSTMAKLTNLDPGWSLGNGMSAHSNPGWLQLYLSACKLLDLALCMHTEDLPQFQL